MQSIRLTWSLLALLISGSAGIAQAKPRLVDNSNYVLFIISDLEDSVLNTWIYPAKAVIDNKLWNLIIFNTQNTSVNDLKDELNKSLNNIKGSNLRHTYLIVLGSDAFLSKHEFLTKTSLFAENAQLSTNSQDKSCFNCKYWRDIPLEGLLKQFARSYLWEIDLAEAKRLALQSNNTKKNEREFGIFLNRSFNHGKQDNYFPAQTSSYGLRFGKHFRPNWRWNIEAEFGYKFPDIESIFQSQISKQLDMSAIQSGAEQEINIKATIDGYFYGGLNAQVQYVFYKEGRSWNPYLSSGFSLMGQLGFEGEIDTTLTIDASSMGAGGLGAMSPQQGGENPFGNDGSRITIASRIPVGMGIRYYLSDRLSLDFASFYHFDLAALQGENLYLNAVQFKLNLAYHFWPKRKNFYRYVR